MNAVELLIFVVFCLLFGALGAFLSARWGPLGWLAATPGVVGAGLLIFGMGVSLFLELRHSFHSRPVCSSGKCPSRAYVLVEANEDEALFRCRCGDLYLSRGDSFLRVKKGGSEEPYMFRNPSGNWEPA